MQMMQVLTSPSTCPPLSCWPAVVLTDSGISTTSSARAARAAAAALWRLASIAENAILSSP
eukprot:CAMPEP_0115338384 /NCGR_PEP_ID=MMETSP0270-20121206/90042_1 /TAXON_ID=71861 /ORGANISM="Scrippsiella trochoidea, Strain CCMP3099" /LENGTH=60 /DNA_ID=CAMNT_0002759683 /DNA_START=42 /DNA_END=221 /DNA_ORIENTATION=-